MFAAEFEDQEAVKRDQAGALGSCPFQATEVFPNRRISDETTVATGKQCVTFFCVCVCVRVRVCLRAHGRMRVLARV